MTDLTETVLESETLLEEAAAKPGLAETIANFFINLMGPFGAQLAVFLCSMLPIIELRGSIILGAAMDLPWWQTYLISWIGNMLPIPFILLFIKKMLQWMSTCKVKFFNKVSNWLMEKAEKNRGKIEKYAMWGLILFVAIPLPGTGAWTGALIASLLDMRMKYSLPAIFAGVCLAGVIMCCASYGMVSFLSFLL